MVININYFLINITISGDGVPEKESDDQIIIMLMG